MNIMIYSINNKVVKCLFLIMLFVSSFSFAQTNNYNIGVGIHDITGEIVEIPYFGYARPFTESAGLMDRQYARAFIIQEPGQQSAVFVSIDKGGMFQSVNQAVMEKLSSRFGGIYTDDNVVISATHSHMTTGSHSHYALYRISHGGFHEKSFNVLVDGIVKAIERAHNSIAPGRIYYARGSLFDASVNRSLPAYNNNTDAHHFEDIDSDMLVLKFVQGQNEEVGMISWFAVHPVSLNNESTLASGDNKGFAALKFEKMKGATYGSNPGFVAAFAQSNAGDMSPNLNQPHPHEHFEEATGPGNSPEESMEIIGERQFQKALEVYNSAWQTLTGQVRFTSRYTDFSEVTVDDEFTDGAGQQKTCAPALGVSFAAGSEDGRTGIFKEGTVNNNPNVGTELQRCHAEKKIILSTEVDGLTELIGLELLVGAKEATPQILPVSILQIGQLGILAGPAEYTIMSGRRIREAVEAVEGTGITETVVAGYSDAYSGYVTTREEYASQQYEGGSTHFGPWTGAAYRQEFSRLAETLSDPQSNPWPVAEPDVPVLPDPIDQTTFIAFDDKPLFKSFGAVSKNARSRYQRGDEVEVQFWGAHPSNDLQIEGTYLEVQQRIGGQWKTIARDRDQATKLIWERNGIAYSLITIRWQTTNETPRGTYRILHDGHWKNGWTGRIKPYSGKSRSFSVR